MLSVIIPVLNEEASLALLHDELVETITREGLEYEIIFVDDGSTDQSWKEIQQLAERHDVVRGVRLRTNFGKAEALSAGIDHANGDIITTIDADLQDDPSDLPLLLAKLREGYHVVSGWKRERNDSWRRVAGSRVFNALVSWLTGVKLHDHNSGFKCYDASVFGEIRLYGELHRFVPVLAGARGFRITEVAVNHRPRPFGKSRYGWMRIPKAMLDLVTVRFLTGFGQRPQHVLGMAGLGGFLAGTIGLSWLVLWWFVSRTGWAAELWPSIEPMHLHTRPVFYLSLTAMVLGAQLMSMGFLAELFVAFQRRDPANYSISETTWSGSASASNGNDAHHIYPLQSNEPHTRRSQ